MFVTELTIFKGDSMENKIYNTSIKEKQAHFEKFVELVRSQFWHGGDKYALTEDKEVTDWVCEIVPGETGVDWVLGTVAKYIGRFKNFKREKDLLKIATYMYIIWLKMGFHLKEEHDEDIKR